MKSLCIYCGASSGASPAYAQAARAMAGAMVERGISLVYGGGRVGLMGVIADEVMRLGGRATGVIPRALMDREVGHTGLTELHVVKDMHERKALMAELADDFVALPGGIGTLEELFEVFTWSQLGMHDKPVALLNAAGYYDGLIAFLEHAVRERFLSSEHAAVLMYEPEPTPLLERLRAFTPPTGVRTYEREQARQLIQGDVRASPCP